MKKNIARPGYWLLCLLVILWGTSFSACGLGVPTVQPVTITFAFPDYDQAFYESLLNKFKAQQPAITIELHPGQTSSGYRPDNTTDVSVVSWEVLTNTNPQEAISASAMPLDAFIEQDSTFKADNFYPGTMDAFKLEGKIYAIPSGLDPWVMYYNRDLFDRYQVPYPQSGWTWDDFLLKAGALTHKEDGVFGYTPRQNYPDALLFLMQHGGHLVDETGKPTLDDPLNVEAMKWYAGLFNDYHVAPTPQEAYAAFGYSQEYDLLGILKGKVGMWSGPLSERGGTTNQVKWNMQWGIVPLPRDKMAFTGAYFEGFAISAASKNALAAWNWISFLSQQAPVRLMPARRSQAESQEYAIQVGKDVAAAAQASLENVLLATPDTVRKLGPVFDLFFQTVTNIVVDEIPAQDALNAAQHSAGQ
ncbi:MAG: extracellular solute-binding protein [Anaerolineaceae bacterium]|jgi:multiple sugar transport system substrate-binding protein